MPALPKFIGLPTSMVTMITEKKTTLFAINIDKRNSQFTELKSSCASDMNINEGRENVPTNVLIPLASVSDIKFVLPAK